MLPAGIQSINGSSTDMKCSPEGLVTDCLFDNNIPHINTSSLTWASGLVTVLKTPAHRDLIFDHVLLTFAFNDSVAITSIEIHLFLCPEWGIGAPTIGIYADNHSEFKYHENDFLMSFAPESVTCGCLSNISIPVQYGEPSYPYWHILISFPPYLNVDWVHLGEVSFDDTPKGRDAVPTLSTDCTFEPPPGTALHFIMYIISHL